MYFEAAPIGFGHEVSVDDAIKLREGLGERGVSSLVQVPEDLQSRTVSRVELSGCARGRVGRGQVGVYFHTVSSVM